MAVDPDQLIGVAALGDAPDRLRQALGVGTSVDGWATVELDRAELEIVAGMAERHEPGATRVEPAPNDRLLGARCRTVRWDDGHEVLLLEPATEGRLAAALARHGEGPLVRYFLVDAGGPERARHAGFRLTTEGRGPFGAERLVITDPRWGPFLVLAGLA